MIYLSILARFHGMRHFSPLSDFDNESPWDWDLPFYKKKTKTELNRFHSMLLFCEEV